MRRFDRLWKILTNRSLAGMGRIDALRVVSVRRERNDRSYSIRLPIGEVFLEGKNVAVDFQVFAQVLLDEIYGELRPKDQVVIDVGAHKGYFAAYALMAGARAVFCYEPELTNFTYLSRFAETARLRGKRIDVFRVAVSDEDGKLALYESTESWSHTIFPSQGHHYAGIVTVRSCSLANVLSCATRAFPAQEIVVKIDAEGAECPLLLNTPPESFAPVKEIVFESHSFACCDLQDILARMQKLGFGYVPSRREPDFHYLTDKKSG